MARISFFPNGTSGREEEISKPSIDHHSLGSIRTYAQYLQKNDGVTMSTAYGLSGIFHLISAQLEIQKLQNKLSALRTEV